MALILRKKRDGTVHLDAQSSFPDEHTFSTRYLAQLPKKGIGQVFVELKLANASATYELVGYERASEEENAAVTGLKFKRVKARPATRAATKRGARR